MVPSGAGVASSAASQSSCVLAQFAVVEPGHGGIQGDDAQPVDEVAVIHRVVVVRLVQEPGPEIGAVVMVAHRPDDLGAQRLARRLHDRAELGVGLRFAEVGQVAGEDHGFGASA